MKGDKLGKVHCTACFKIISNVKHAAMDEDDNFTFLCDDCYEKLKPFYVKGASNVNRTTH